MSLTNFLPYMTLECSKCFEEIGSVAVNPSQDLDGHVSENSILCPKCYDKVFPY